MKVYELHSPINDGSLLWGRAVSASSRYEFCATRKGEVYRAFREDPLSIIDGRSFWESIKAPLALRDAVRKAVAP